MLKSQLQSFIDYLQFEKKYSSHTIISYNNDILQFIDFVNQEKALASFSSVDYRQIRSWIADLIKNKITAKTVNRKLSSLKSLFKFLQRHNEITINPMAKITGPKVPKRLPVFIDENQMNNLFDSSLFAEDFIGMRDKLIIDLLYQTGIRRTELANLKVGDVDLYNSTIKVLGKRNKERLIPISLAFKRNLETYLNVKEETTEHNMMLLVNQKGRTMSEQAIYKMVNKYLSLVTTSKKKSPHILRHTFATHLLNNGADINAVKDLLGHANLNATQIYTHNTIDKLKKSYKQAHPRGDT